MLIELISQYGLFLAKIVTVLAAILLLVIFIFQGKQRGRQPGSLQLTDLNQHYRQIQQSMQTSILADAEQKLADKLAKKQRKKEDKQKSKAFKQQQKQTKGNGSFEQKKRRYVLAFAGSSDAHEVEALREEVSAILSVAKEGDEVLLRLESPGGVVHGYGLAASQLQRLRDRQIPLTVVVDKVAASGGYMMACVAQQIVAAPFAILGSIGVVAQLPNFHRLLKKNDIDIELHTAGQYKRTLTLFGENSEQGREKFQSELNETHQLFKDFVKTMRPLLDIDKVATGEFWFGSVALEKGLVDRIATSDDLIMESIKEWQVIAVEYKLRKKWTDRFALSLMGQFQQLLSRYWQRGQQPLL